MNIKEIIRNFIESDKRKSKSELARLGAQKVQETLEQLEGNEAYNKASKDEQILEIISDSNDLDYKDKVRIAEQLNDDERMDEVKQELKEEQRILAELQQIYKKCNEDMNDAELEEQLNKVTENIHVYTQRICKQRNRIIARKIAFNYAIFGTNIVSKQRGLMLPKQMYENGIIQTAKEEYEKIVEEYCGMIKGREIKEFDEEELEKNIIEEIKETERDSEFDERTVLERIIGIMQTTMSLEERRMILESFEQGILNKETYLDILKFRLIKPLSQFPHTEREKALETFKRFVIKRNLMRNAKVAQKTPRVKDCKFNNEGR